MKIIIIGAKGALGQQINEVFKLDYSSEVFAFDIEDLDIIKEDEVKKKINDIHPDLIINCAAYNNVDKCEEGGLEFSLAREINISAVGYLARAAIDCGAIFVHFSSDYVFSGDKEGGYLETDIPTPVNKYGQSKLGGEKEILSLASQDLKYYLIRTSKLFGPKGSSLGAKNNFFDLMREKANKGEAIKAVDEELSCFTYTPDLAVAVKDLVDKKYPFGIYHLTNEGPVTWYGAVEKMFELLGAKVDVQAIKSDDLPRPAKRPKYSVLLNTKGPKMRGYEEALEEYLGDK
jgi:dTDP-4-dehydrorhamnose reductase